MRTRVYARGANLSNCGMDAVHIIGSADVDVTDANLSNSGRYGIYVDQSQALARLRSDFAIPSSISDDDIRDAARMAAVVPESYRLENLEKRKVGRWAKENGLSLAQLAAAPAQLGVAIFGM